MENNNFTHMQNADAQKKTPLRTLGIIALALILALVAYFASRQGSLFRADLLTVPSQPVTNAVNTLYIPNNYQSESPNLTVQKIPVLVGDDKFAGGILKISATLTYKKSDFTFEDNNYLELGEDIFGKSSVADGLVETDIDPPANTKNRLKIDIVLNNNYPLAKGKAAFYLKFRVPSGLTPSSPAKKIGLEKGKLEVKKGAAGGTVVIADVTGIEALDIITISCASGTHLSGSACVANDSVTMCGLSAKDCTLGLDTNATAACSGSPLACVYTCKSGFHMVGTVCRANTDPTSCGETGTPCTMPTNGIATCDGTSCGVTCNPGYNKNGLTCVAGTSITSCGTPPMNCTTNLTSNAIATCDGTSCGFTCNNGYAKSGSACVDINECDTNNGGCSINANCTNTPGSRTCACKAGFNGTDGITCNAPPTTNVINCPSMILNKKPGRPNMILRAPAGSVAWKKDGQVIPSNMDNSVTLTNLVVGSHSVTANGLTACVFDVDCYTSIDKVNARKAIGATDAKSLLLYDYDGNGKIEMADRDAISEASKFCN
jgi:hypothetical protein